MKRLIVILKRSLHTINAIVAVVVVAAYLITHFNLTGRVTRSLITGDLARYLGTEVMLDNAEVDIFNQVVLENLLIKDLAGDTLLFARRAMASFDLLPLLRKELEIHTVQLIDFDFRLSRQDSAGEANFQFIIDKFIPKDKNNRRRVIDDIALNSIILRSGSLTYNDFSKPLRREFLDVNHLKFDDISANLKIQATKEQGLYVNLKRLSLDEQSGLSVTRASTVIELDRELRRLDFNDISLACQQALGAVADGRRAEIALAGFASMENMKLGAEVQSLKVKVKDVLEMEAAVKVDDALSSAGGMIFSAQIDRLGLAASALPRLLARMGKDAGAVEKYSAGVDEIQLVGSAEGSAQRFSYKADLECFGEMSSDVSLRGVYADGAPLNCEVSALVRGVEIKKYAYEEVAVQGTLDGECFDGAVSIDDPLCRATARGRYHFGKAGGQRIDAVAAVMNIEPYLLNLTDIANLEGVRFAGKIDADISLRNPQLPQGTVRVDSLVLQHQGERLVVPEIRMEALRSGGKNVARLSSQYFDALWETEDGAENIVTEVRESKALSGILRLPVSIGKTASARIRLDSLRRVVDSEIVMPQVVYDGADIDLYLTSRQEDDSLRHLLRFDYNKNGNRLASTLHATSLLDPRQYIDIAPCKLRLNNDVIDCQGATVAQLDGGKYDFAIHVEDLGIDSLCSFLDSNYLKFGGVATGDIHFTSDSVRYVSAENLFVRDFSYLGGRLGDTRLTAGYDIDRRRVDVAAEVHSPEDSISHITGYIQIAEKDSLDLMIGANRLNMELLKYWVGGFLEDIEGTMTGDVHLYGLARELKLVGRPFADISFTNHLSGSRFFVKDYIALTKEKDSEFGYFTLDNARILDRFDHEAFATAQIRHRYLRKYNYDVRVDFPDDGAGFLLFDHPTHYNNEVYWGQLFTSGSCLLRGGDGRHRIEVSCRTVGRSYFNLSPNEENYSDNGYNFLTFRDKREHEAAENTDYSATGYFAKPDDDDDSGTYIEFDLQAEATENCQVYVQMDPLAEDRLICRGTGPISLHYDPRNDITIGGEYNITQGNYLVTMRGDLINKEFKIQNGSRVSFPGSFSNAELDINAVYAIPSVNLRDLDESFATMASMNRTTLPVDCKLAVTGQLSAPQIAFDLEVKNTSDDVQALVHNIIGTQEMLNREVFYLLLFSKFYTPEYASASQNNSGSELSSFTSASLTSQLNNLLGHMSDNFTLGTNFRSDKGDFSDIEMDLSLSTRLFSDRLILNGNLGYRDPANRVGLNNNTDSFIGDFDVEYLINPRGTLRAKAYSHYNERDYSINNALTTQGIGFVVRKDFKTVKELLFWKKRHEK